MAGPDSTILDGAGLAAARMPALAARAAAITRRNGRPPCLALVAFGTPGKGPPWLARKRRAAAAAGIAVREVALTTETSADAFAEVLHTLASDPVVDGIFVQYPLPGGRVADSVFATIPVDRDVDAMSPAAWRRFEAGTGPPPATVDAALALLDASGIVIGDRSIRVVGEPGHLARAFEIAFDRRGAQPLPRVAPDDPDLPHLCAEAGILVALAERPGAVRSEWLAGGAIAIDGGYFNAGGSGDIDTADGIAHLSALVPVPGGLGPMTVSVLIERTITAAER